MGGMNVDSLSKILKICGPNDSLKLKYANDADTVNFQCETSEEDRIADFDLKLMQIESDPMEIPEQQYKVIAKLPSSEFLRICRDLKEFGETGRKGGFDRSRTCQCHIRFALSGHLFEGCAVVWHGRIGIGSRCSFAGEVRFG